MFEELFSYGELLEAEPSLFGFGDVTFKQDFGPWKKDENIDSIWFTTEGEPKVEQQDENGDVIKTCKFKLVAVQ